MCGAGGDEEEPGGQGHSGHPRVKTQEDRDARPGKEEGHWVVEWQLSVIAARPRLTKEISWSRAGEIKRIGQSQDDGGLVLARLWLL